MKSQHFKKNDIDCVTLFGFILPPFVCVFENKFDTYILVRLCYFRMGFKKKSVCEHELCLVCSDVLHTLYSGLSMLQISEFGSK